VRHPAAGARAVLATGSAVGLGTVDLDPATGLRPYLPQGTVDALLALLLP